MNRTAVVEGWNQVKAVSKGNVLGMVLALFIFGKGVPAKDLHLSEAKDISELGLARVCGQEVSKADGIRMMTLNYSIDVTDCNLYETAEGYDRIAIKNVRCQAEPGKPEVAMKTLKARLSWEAEVLGIEVSRGSYHEIKEPVNITAGAAPHVWMRDKDMPEQIRRRMQQPPRDSKVYSLETYFPGEIVTYSTGRDNNSTFVHVRVLPVQYIPARKKAVLITDATITVYYRLRTLEQKASSSPGVDLSQCVIICPSSLTAAAEILRDFHIDQQMVSTSVLSTEDIDITYDCAPDPIHAGYRDDYVGKDKIVGYNYELAKKIISYLRDRDAHPNLQYVTLFGDGALVPPSYYVNEHGEYGLEEYLDWIPTDYLYSSPDYDFVPNYKVGRLPVSDAAQAISVVNKHKRWHSSLSWSWFRWLSVCGGRPFDTMYYYGELSCVDIINTNSFNGMEVSKWFYTNGAFDAAHIEPLFTRPERGILLHFGHGNGYELYLQTDSISATNVIGYPLCNQLPVVVSCSCVNGAYDNDLTNFEYQPEYPELPYPTSFGESIVLSNSGGIAYVGGTRLGYADWSTSYDQGRLISSHQYMTQLINRVFESYHQGSTRLGDLTDYALRCYAQDNNMGMTSNRLSLFGFVLLGDPVLGLVPQHSGPNYQKPYLSAVEPDRYGPTGIPRYENLTTGTSAETISVTSNSDSPIDAKSFYLWREKRVGWQHYEAPPLTHTFTPPGCGDYLVRSSAGDGKEGWLYLNAQLEFPAKGDVLLIDDDYGENIEGYYTGSLYNLGWSYDVWEVGARGSINGTVLSEYLDGTVVWSLPYRGITEADKATCQSYLDSGGNLFVSGQDIGFHLTHFGKQQDYFYEHYLHADFVADDSYQSTLTGIPGDPIGDGLTIVIDGNDGADNQQSTDEIEPVSPAVPVFVYEPNCEGALRVDTGTYRIVYFSFGFEGINSQVHRDEVMRRVLQWLMPFGRADLDEDRDVDFADYAVFGQAWLSEPNEPGWNPKCDIEFPNDNFVDIQDLSAFAQRWLTGTRETSPPP